MARKDNAIDAAPAADAPAKPADAADIDNSVQAVDLQQPPLPAGEKMVTIVPRFTDSRTRIGGVWYAFEKGVAMRVPENVRQHLQERDLL